MERKIWKKEAICCRVPPKKKVCVTSKSSPSPPSFPSSSSSSPPPHISSPSSSFFLSTLSYGSLSVFVLGPTILSLTYLVPLLVCLYLACVTGRRRAPAVRLTTLTRTICYFKLSFSSSILFFLFTYPPLSSCFLQNNKCMCVFFGTTIVRGCVRSLPKGKGLILWKVGFIIENIFRWFLSLLLLTLLLLFQFPSGLWLWYDGYWCALCKGGQHPPYLLLHAPILSESSLTS